MEETGAITGYVDVAQLVLYGFWIFFAGLVYYLLRENKREGYPMDSADRGGNVVVVGFPLPPKPKTFLLPDGSQTTVPREEAAPPINAEPSGVWPGAPYDPTGDAMLSRLGPGAYPEREKHPDLTIDGRAKIVPMRIAEGYSLAPNDPDPRGMPVVGADGEVGGKISDLWVDRSDPLIRYFEVTVSGTSRRVLLPINFGHINTSERRVEVEAINGAHFAQVPGLANDETVTFLEEDAASSFYAGGLLFANESRAEPLL